MTNTLNKSIEYSFLKKLTVAELVQKYFLKNTNYAATNHAIFSILMSLPDSTPSSKKLVFIVCP